MKKISFLYFLCLSGIVLICNSCLDEYTDFSKYKDVTLKHHLAIPLGYADFSVQDLINKLDTVVAYKTDSLGTLLLVYEDSLYSPGLLDQISPGSFGFAGSIDFNIDQPVFVPAGDTLVTDNLEYSMPFESKEGMRIDSMTIRAGELIFNLVSGLPGTTLITLHFPAVFRDGMPVTEELIFQGGVESGGPEFGIIDLSDSKLIFASETTDPVIKFTMQVSYVSTGGILTPAQEIGFEINSSISSLRSIYGYLGNHMIIFPDEKIKFNIFKIFRDGLLNFSFPHMRIDLATNGGVPLGIKIRGFYIESSDRKVFPLTGRILDSLVYIVPDEFDQLENYRTNFLEVNENNSSFRDLFKKIPREMNFNIQAELNPPEFDLNRNYLTEKSKIQAHYKITLPLSLTLFDLHGSDTTLFDLDSIDLDEVKEVSVRVHSNNGLPLGGKARIVFLDSAQNTVLDLFEGESEIINPAITDENGVPAEPSEGTFVIALNEEQKKALFSAKYLAYEIVLNTDRSNQEILVRITEDSFIRLDVGIEAILETTGEIK